MGLGYTSDLSALNTGFYTVPSFDMYGSAFNSNVAMVEDAIGSESQNSSQLLMQLSIPELSSIPDVTTSTSFQVPHPDPEISSDISIFGIPNDPFSQFEPEGAVPTSSKDQYHASFESGAIETESQRSHTSSTVSKNIANSQPRPFVCGFNGCIRSYKRKYELQRHQRKHSGLRPWGCRFMTCNKAGQNGFARKDHLMQHLRQVHRVSS